ncbi:hypothetical protein [Microbulbifer variabilis]|uniref:hypothetical protein n=1 Tax=Microbulbifer variabilis TaxID=266805 RepID=UPI00037958C1|nr:hypothetical protein [Microbulbifer variabilis]
MNNEHRARDWINFILERCQFPDAQVLKEHLDKAMVSEFCQCGCNSFKVMVSANTKAIAAPDKYGVIFEANFNLEEAGKTLEILIFSGKSGMVEYIEIDCCGNNFPVPEAVEAVGEPFHVSAGSVLAL